MTGVRLGSLDLKTRSGGCQGTHCGALACGAELATAAAATHNWAAQPHVAEYLYGKLLAHFDTHLIGLLPSKL